MKQDKKVYVVGTGPGAWEEMTIKAAETLKQCDVIVGYTVYTDLLKEKLPDKEYKSTPMRKEVDRCLMALEEADNGRKVAMVCSGDSGIYGMAGLMLELQPRFPEVEVEIVAGVTAALSGGACLGAPMTHDSCIISLSDLLTPWETIEKRLLAAAQGDFVIVLYNPSSKKRKEYLKRACQLILTEQKKETVCAIVRNIGRAEESQKLLTLEELTEAETDMFSTVFIGNSQTRIIGNKMVTPRGYRHEEQ